MALAQLVSRQQPRLHLDELPFIEKELQQLVRRQVAATCKSVQTTVRALYAVIRAHTTTYAAVRECSCLYASVDACRELQRVVYLSQTLGPIWMPFQRYHYVRPESRCAKFYLNRFSR